MSFSRENELLVTIARRDIDLDRRSELRALASRQLDWNYLYLTAQAHGLLPLMQKHLTTVADDVVPGHFLSRLKRDSVANSQNVLHLAGKQLRVYQLFKQEGIPVALFKGSLLAEMAYGEISLRQAGDIDVLINRQHFTEARTLLEALGYKMMPALSPAQLASHLNHHCEIQFMRDEWFTVVDLHWDLAPRSFVFLMSAEEVLSRLQTVSLAGTTIETFGPEDLLLYQAMHGAKHLWRRLEWISSLAESIRSTHYLDWETLLSRATHARATRMLALGLHLVKEFSEVPIPQSALLFLDATGSMQSMAQHLRQTIFSTHGPADSTETNLYNLRVMDRKRDAVRSAFRALFVPTVPDWQALSLPASLHSLYYAYRPLRLSKVYTTALWRKLSQAHSGVRNA